VFGSIGAYFEGAWSLERVAAQTAASASVAQFTGGDIVQSGIIGLATSLSAYIYYSGQGENPNTNPGENPVCKDDNHWSESTNQNVGISRPPGSNEFSFYHEHGLAMRILGHFPLFNAMATWHDNWVAIYKIPQPLWDYFFRFTPGHALAYGITIGAHFSASNPAYFMSYK
jgi:hypothetical protein